MNELKRKEEVWWSTMEENCRYSSTVGRNFDLSGTSAWHLYERESQLPAIDKFPMGYFVASAFTTISCDEVWKHLVCDTDRNLNEANTNSWVYLMFNAVKELSFWDTGDRKIKIELGHGVIDV